MSKKPKGFKAFDELARKLVKVPSSELPRGSSVTFKSLAVGEQFRFFGMTNHYEKVDENRYRLFGDGRYIQIKIPTALVIRWL